MLEFGVWTREYEGVCGMHILAEIKECQLSS